MFSADILMTEYGKLNKLFTYLVRDEHIGKLQRGMRVLVPFGKYNKPEIGLIVGFRDADISIRKLKYISELIDSSPIIGDLEFNMAKFMANRFLMSFSNALDAFLPPGDLKSIDRRYNTSSSGHLSELYKVISENEGISYDDLCVFYDEEFLKSELKNLVESGFIKETFNVKSKAVGTVKQYVELIDTDNEIEVRLKNSKKKSLVVNYLKENKKVYLDEIISNLKTTKKLLLEMENMGIIKIVDLPAEFKGVIGDVDNYTNLMLNSQQLKCVNDIQNSKKRFHLIHGVTGSGKTEIYLNLAEHVIAKGYQVLYLVPEIGLTPQTVNRVAGRFKNRVALIHSKLNQTEKLEEYYRIKNGEADIVIGVRSAIFAPLQKLGLIIADEEHDGSYLPMQSLRYDVIELAEYRASIQNALLVLGSATPSLRSYKKTVDSVYELHVLKDRANCSSLPEISLVDMRLELKEGNFSIFSRKLIGELIKNKKIGKQSMIFLNQRGYSPVVKCRKCGFIHKCNDCDVSLTYHSDIRRMICHYCGKTAKPLVTCPKCGSKYPFIKPFGSGTQHIESEIARLIPQASLIRMDSDTMTAKDSYENAVKNINEGRYDIIIGTQIITKGHDFKNVNLVGIINADSTLNFPSFSANERAFQLFTQVAGRAGRGGDLGKVIIQTYEPSNAVLDSVLKQDYEKFYSEEIIMRKNFFYPPFSKLIMLLVSSKNQKDATESIRKFHIKLCEFINSENISDNVKVTGPFMSPIAYIKKRFRYYITIKADDKVWDKLGLFLIRVYINDNYDIFKYNTDHSIYINPENNL